MSEWILKKTLLSQKLKAKSFIVALMIVVIISLITATAMNPFWPIYSLFVANPNLVFDHHQYYRLWTTLFVHGGLEHISSNMLLFIPFAVYLINYYGLIFFPIEGIFIGGIINFIVLKTMPTQVSLIGISGVVHWMGAAWITLFFLIDKRITPLPRFIKAFGVALILFVPNTFSENISYLSHLVGFILGIFSGFFYYYRNQKRIHQFDVYEQIFADEIEEYSESVEDISAIADEQKYLH